PKPDNRMPALDDALGVVGGPIDVSGRVVTGHLGLEEHRQNELDRERAEQARLFYVACTRAQDVLVLLEGKGDARYLREEKGARHVWCHQVWDVLGRARLAAFVARGAPEETLALAGGGTVRVERAARYLDPAGAGSPMPMPEPRVAPAGEAERTQVARVLGFAPPPPREVVTSPTALADFRRCPRQYWYRQVLGLPERGTGGLRATRLGTAAHGVLEAVDFATAPDGEIARLVAARPEALALRPSELAALAADLRAATAALRGEIAAGLAIVGREVPALVDAGVALGQALASGAIDAFPRRPEAPAACERLGCGYVRRCWGLAPSLTRRASSRPSDCAAS